MLGAVVYYTHDKVRQYIYWLSFKSLSLIKEWSNRFPHYLYVSEVCGHHNNINVHISPPAVLASSGSPQATNSAQVDTSGSFVRETTLPSHNDNVLQHQSVTGGSGDEEGDSGSDTRGQEQEDMAAYPGVLKKAQMFEFGN